VSLTPIAIYFYLELNKSVDRDVVVIAQKFQCTICGYIYDPEKGDPDSGASPGMPFEDLPDSWTCPQCGAMKDDFKEVD
jgi:rubredoxin